MTYLYFGLTFRTSETLISFHISRAPCCQWKKQRVDMTIPVGIVYPFTRMTSLSRVPNIIFPSKLEDRTCIVQNLKKSTKSIRQKLKATIQLSVLFFHLGSKVPFFVPAPSSVLDLSFVNEISSFWKGQIKWNPPEIPTCVHFYRYDFGTTVYYIV